ncbi:MAG: BON domain-containing protein [Oleiphilaceae bacterium]|nr:BON domain-containing protein [Oleiphilaceae bacterium]
MNRYWGLCFVLLLALSFGCSSPASKEAALPSQQDSPEALRIKAALMDAQGLGGSAIDVTYHNNEIILEGFVETSEQRTQAETIAREQGQAASVVNKITVK